MSSDLPPELAESSDGVSDDGAMDLSIIGAGAFQPSIVGASSYDLIGCGLDGIQGLPWYNLARAGVSTPVAKRRFLAALAKLPPKARRRVLAKLRAVSASNAVSGAIRAATPSIAGSGTGWSLVSGPSIAIGGGRSRCPYANVAGPLTP